MLYKFSLSFTFLVSGLLCAQNNLPVLVQKSVEIQGNRITVTFDATDSDDQLLEIQCKLFSLEDATLHEEIVPIQIGGDIGYPVMQGHQKIVQITIDPLITYKTIRLVLKVSDRAALDIQELLGQVDTASLYNTVSILQGRRNNNDKIFYDASRDYIFNRLNASVKTKKHIAQQPPLQLINIEGTQTGFQKPEEVIIIDAHYDSFGSSPGADDNASGVAGVLEAQRILAPYCSNKTLRYVLFDLEEAGLIGSLLYVSNQVSKRESIKSVFNFEMIGFYSEEPNTQELPTGFNILFPDAYNKVIQDQRRGNFITNVANTTSSGLKSIFDQSAATYVPTLKVISVEVPGNGSIAPDLRRSDHASFWDKGIPALMLTDGANFRNKKYHTANDSLHYLHFGFMSNVIKSTIASVIQLGEVEHASCLEIPISFPTHVSNDKGFNSYVSAYKQTLYIRTSRHLQNATISVFNPEGQVLYQKNNLELSQQSTAMSCAPLKIGIYYMLIKSGKEISVSKFVVHD
ncbi:MAG: M28 family peptidase [Saprospiraceae bacterium]|nr:M28 family peptidase [Saprospiraceae bacterium]